ncbi:MAG: hypothetical protein HY043_07110 [Verrucomicrobia bacterium]|nr:hypothetical protein [Verrucomicrobiota bacterium]
MGIAKACYGEVNFLLGANQRAVGALVTHWRRNATGFFSAHRGRLGLLLLAACADGASTIAFMSRSGVEMESHPVIRLVAFAIGPIAGAVVGKICQLITAVVVAIYFRRWAGILLATLALLYLWAAWFNFWGQNFYTPRILHWLG